MSCSEIVIKKKGCGKKQKSSSSNTLTSDCYSDSSSSSSTSCSPSSSSVSCVRKKKCSSSSQPSIEVIELTTSSSSSSSECSNSNDCCRGGGRKRRECRGCNSCRSDCYKPGRTFGDCYYCFYAIVGPLSNFKLLDGTTSVNGLKISVAISGKTTTLSWQGFSGLVTSSGIAFVYISQFFKGLPMYDVFGSYLINYSGGDALSTVQVLANNTNTIQWYIQANRKGSSVAANSYIAIMAGSITFINNCDSC